MRNIVLDAQKLQAGLQQICDSHQETANNVFDFAACSNDLASRNAELAGHNAELVVSNAESQRQLHDAKDVCSRHEATILSLQEQLQRVEKDLQNREQAMHSSTSALQSQTERLAQATKRAEGSEKGVRLQTIEIDRMRTRLDQVNEELYRVNGSRAVAERLFFELKSKVRDFEQRRDTMVSKTELDRVNELLVAANADLKHATEEGRQLKDQLNNARKTTKIELSGLEEHLAATNSGLEHAVEDNTKLFAERDAGSTELKVQDMQLAKVKAMLAPAICSNEENQRTPSPALDTCNSAGPRDTNVARAHTEEIEGQELIAATDTEIKLVRACITILLVDASCVMVVWLLDMPQIGYNTTYLLFLALVIADGSYLALVIG
jgi:chromosome segregation ATPase